MKRFFCILTVVMTAFVFLWQGGGFSQGGTGIGQNYTTYKQRAAKAPSPGATYNRFYFKSDGKPYYVNSSGTETEVGGGTFSVTDISGATADSTPATTSEVPLNQGGSLIKSTLGQIGTALGIVDWTADQGATNIHANNIPDLSGVYQAAHASLSSIAGLTETNGGIPYGTADNTYAWLGAGATGKALIAKGAAAPEWTPYTFPATVPTVGKALISDGTNLIGSTALGTAAYATLGTGAGQVPVTGEYAPAAGSTSIVSYGPTALQEASCAANALTLTPTAALGIVNVSVTQTGDANCAVTMAETGAAEGTIAIIKNVSDGAAETLTFTTSAGVLTLIQGSPFAMAINETLILQYKNSEWLEIGRASATINISDLTVGNGATSSGFIYFLEDSTNGTNKVKLEGPQSTADVTVTLPAVAGTLGIADAPPTGTVGSGSITVSTNNTYVICTDTCSVTLPVAAAGIQACVRNAPGVTTAITLVNRASQYYELTNHSAWATVNQKLVSGGAATDSICVVGYDATHYATMSSTGTWTDTAP